MPDKEIQEMFKEKNREMIKNNLKLDVDRNIDALVNTITNIFNSNFEIAIRNIESIYEDSIYLDSSKIVIKYMNKLKIDSFVLITKGIDEKKNALNDKIDRLMFEDDIDDYYDLVFKTSSVIEELFKSNDLYEINKELLDSFNEYSDVVLNRTSVNITKSRISDYINYRLFGKISEKVKNELNVRDNNLANMGRESYEKFQSISSMTTNI